MNIDRPREAAAAAEEALSTPAATEAASAWARGAGAAPEPERAEEPAVFAEWSGAAGGLSTEVELRLHPSQNPHRQPPGAAPTPAPTPAATDSEPHYNLTGNDAAAGGGGGGAGGGVGAGVVVRAEEALIVAFVLLLWVAAIALFFNRWGKIRMLEPYQPKFQQQHRASCPADPAASALPPQPPPLSAHAHRASLSRGCGSCGDYTLMLGGGGGGGALFQQCAGYSYQAPYLHLAHRPRQNSVFVGSTGAMALIPESPARRSRSAADLRALLQPPRARAAPAHALTVTDV